MISPRGIHTVKDEAQAAKENTVAAPEVLHKISRDRDELPAVNIGASGHMHALQHRGMDWLCTLHQSMQTARLYPSQLLKTTAHSVNSKLQYVLSGVSSSIWALYCTAAYRQEGTSIPSTARKSIDLGIIIPRMWTIQQWGAQTRTGSPFNTDSSFLCGPQCLAPLTLWDMA